MACSLRAFARRSSALAPSARWPGVRPSCSSLMVDCRLPALAETASRGSSSLVRSRGEEVAAMRL